MGWIISEAELREYWQNGKADLPVFPLGTRFTPAAEDFLRDHYLIPMFSEEAKAIFATNTRELNPPNHNEIIEQSALPKIYTETDILDLVNQGITEIIIKEGVILTDLAREKALKLGIRIILDNCDHKTISAQQSHNIYRYERLTSKAAGKDIALGKTIYTDEDIERMYHSGQKFLVVNDQTILTDLAREKVALFGMQLSAGETVGISINERDPSILFTIIKEKVMAKINSTIDEKVVDAVIQKVISNLR